MLRRLSVPLWRTVTDSVTRRRLVTGRMQSEALEPRVLLTAAPAPLSDLLGRSSDGLIRIAGSTETSFVHEDGQTPGIWDGVIPADLGPLHAGDFDNDGLTDLVAFSPVDGQWIVWRANGQGFNAPESWGEWSTAVLWSDFQIADFNGDGLADVAARASTGRWVVGLSDGNRFVRQAWGIWSTNVDWLDVQTADLNGDGSTDILGRATSGTWVAALSDGTSFRMVSFGAWSSNVSWSDVHTADINGDGLDDVIGRASNGRWVVGISDSTRFATRSFGIWSTNVAWSDVVVGDVNGDGRADVVGRASTGTWVAGLSNGSQMTTVPFGAWSNQVTWHDVTPGDFNGDGLLDLAGRDQHGRWWIARSTGTRFVNGLWGTWPANTTWGDVLAGNFLKAEDDTRERSLKLERIVLGLHEYHNEFAQFPVDNVPELLGGNGKPLLSWRVHILPFLGYADLYREFHIDEPWNSPHNLTLLDQMPDIYLSRGMEGASNRTGFRLFEGNGAYDYNADGGPRLRDAVDGTQQTILVIETMPENTAFWTRPEDIVFRSDLPLSGLTLPPDFFLAATVDGVIRKVNPHATVANSAAVTTWDGGEVLSSDQFRNVFLDWAGEDSRNQSRQKLREIGIAFHNFHDSNISFPPGRNTPPEWFDPVTGLPYLSWRVHLLPFLGYGDLYQQFRFDEPWDSPNNIQLLDKMPEVFRSNGLTPGGTTSAFKLITGPDAYVLRRLPDELEADGPRIRDIIDGTGSTIMVVELPADKAVPWTQWNEVNYSPANPLAGIGPIPATGMHVLMFDGSVRSVSPAAKPQHFGIFATTNQHELIGPVESFNVFLDWAKADSPEQRSFKLREVALAMHNFHDTFSAFPIIPNPDYWDETTGLPKLSWRVYLLPYLGYSALFDEFHLDEAWDSPHNIQLLNRMPEVFRTRGVPYDSHSTALKLFIGEGAYAYGPDGRGPRFRDLSDGAASSIMAIELLPDRAVEWTRPDGDILFDPANPLAALGIIPPDGLKAVMYDGSVKTVSPTITADQLKTFVTISGGEVFGPSESTSAFLDWQRPEFPGGPYYPAWLAADSTYRKNNLKQVGLALHNYHDTFNHFPASLGGSWIDNSQYDPETGMPYLSWRVHLLPYLGYATLYEQFHLNEPWDSPHNIQLLDKMPEIFRSRGLPDDSTKTGIQLFLGEGAYTYTYQYLSVARGPRINEITDGLSNTFVVIETMPEDAVEWTRPDGDIAWNPDNPYGGLTIPPDFFLVLLFDGSVRTLHPQLDEEEFRAFVTIAGGEPISYG